MNNLIAIAATEARLAADGMPDASLEDRARAAMRATRRHWLVTDDGEQFQAACEGLAQHCKQAGRTEDFDRVLEDANRLAKAASLIRALTSGVPVAWDEIETPEPADEALGLRGLWLEVRAS